ncbi:hypothetical protein HY968_03740 [Candidatus Kaiserbacteria bacterium]|nr:hypothetical protein [Candidatus Kaiserbacteria bacterium]
MRSYIDPELFARGRAEKARRFAARHSGIFPAYSGARIAGVSALSLLVLGTSALAFEIIAPPGSANRAAIAYSLVQPMRIAQTASVSGSGVFGAVGDFFSTLFSRADTPVQPPPASPIVDVPAARPGLAASSSPTVTYQYVTNNPVVERTIERIMYRDPESVESPSHSIAGATLADLAALRGEIFARLTSFSQPVSFPQQVAAAGVPASYGASPPAAQKIDRLDGVTITNASISGGTISGTSGAGIGDNATTTSFFAAVGHFTTGILDALSSAAATITSLTSTTLVATNATFTNSTTTYATTTNLYVSATSTTQGLRVSSLDCSSLGNGGTLTTDASGNVVCAADDSGSGGATFGKTFEIANGALSPTTTIGLLVSASSTFNGGASFDRSTTTNATSTTLFSTLGRFTTGIFDSLLTAAAATITNLTATTLTATNATTTRLDSLDYVAVGRTATTTIRGDGIASTIPYASSTALSVSGTASTSNLIVSNNFTFGALTGFLKATAGAITTALVDLASNVTGILPVGNGGTGQSAIAANAVVLGNGTGAFATTSAGTNGQVLALVGGVPSWVATTTLSTISGTLAVGSGGTGQTTFTSSQLLYGNGTGGLLSVATSSASCSSGVSCSSFTVIGSAPSITNSGLLSLAQNGGGSAQTGAITLATSSAVSFNGLSLGHTITNSSGTFTFGNTLSGTLNNTGLTNSTISGVSLGSNLTDLTATNGTLTLSGTYNGSAARTIGLNLGNGNTWTALQQFSNASTSMFSSYGPTYFGATATSSFGTNGALTMGGNIILNGKYLSGDGGDEGVYVDTSGNVGIGTTTPQNKLSVIGGNTSFYGSTGVPGTTEIIGNVGSPLSSRIAYGTDGTGWKFAIAKNTAGTYTDQLTIVDSGNVGIGTTGPGQLLQVGTTLYVDNTNGRVGIKTASPSVPLEITADSGGNGLRVIGTGGTLQLQQGGVQSTLNIISSTVPFRIGTANGATIAGAEVDIQAAGTTAMSIINGGNVGIGTTGPGYKLDVIGEIKARLAAAGDSTGVTLGNGGSQIPYVKWTASDDSARFKIQMNGLNTSTERLSVYAGPLNGIATTETLVIGGNGNVGIGTTTPGGIFQVSKDATYAVDTGAALRLSNVTVPSKMLTAGYDNTIDAAYIQSLHSGSAYKSLVLNPNGGNVGIGTAGPTASITGVGTILDISGSTGGGFTLHDTLGGNLGEFSFYKGSNGVFLDSAGAATLANDDIIFRTGRSVSSYTVTEAMRIQASTGNVGIGTTTPDSILSISGSSAALTISDTRDLTWSVGDVMSSIGFRSNDASGSLAGATRAKISTVQEDTFGTFTGLAFSTHNGSTLAEKLRITNGGNIGIGTSTPAYKFEVSGGRSNFTDNSGSYTIGATYKLGDGTYWMGASDSASPDLLFSNAAGAEKLRLTNAGNVGIGTTNPDARTQITGGGLCVGSDANCNTDNNTEGVVYSSATSMTVYDVAENYPTRDTGVGPADIVALDTENGVFVKKAAASGGRILGVISENPAVLLGGFNGAQFKKERQVAVGLSGRIPVKVSLEGGAIHIGDYLSLSSMPGVAKKAQDGEQTIGYALENYVTQTASSTIQFFITHSAFAGLSVADLTQELRQKPAQNGMAGRFLANIFARMREWLADAANGITDFFAKRVHTDELCVGDQCLNEGDVKAILQQVHGQNAAAAGSQSTAPGNSNSGQSSTTQNAPQKESASSSETQSDNASITENPPAVSGENTTPTSEIIDSSGNLPSTETSGSDAPSGTAPEAGAAPEQTPETPSASPTSSN